MTDRALILANRLPFPADDGWKVRTMHVVRAVADVMPTTLVVFTDGKHEEHNAAFEDWTGGRVRVVTKPLPPPYSVGRLLRGAMSRDPIQVWNHHTNAFARAVDDIVRTEQPTVAVAVCAFMYPYLERHVDIPVRVIDTHNVDSELMWRYVPYLKNPLKRLYARLTAKKLEHLEDRTFTAADQVWVCSEEERVSLLKRRRGFEVHTLPNGVDVESIASWPAQVQPRRILFFGKLNYFPNQDALEFLAEDIIPQLRTLVRDFQVDIVGLGADQAVTELCAGVPEMNLIGPVEDIRDALAGADIILVPLRMGSGTRLKILEALAAGRPVVSTSVGAEGIDVEAGRDLLIANAPDELAQAVAGLCDDPGRAAEIGQAGQRAVRSKYDWSIIGKMIAARLNGTSETETDQPVGAAVSGDS